MPVDLALGEFDKKILRMGLKLVSRKLNRNADAREVCLAATSNKPINILNKLVIVAAGNLKAPWQSKTIKTFGQFALWLFLKDTAYRDVFFWSLYKLLKMAEKLLPLVEPYVKEPKLWYPNQWVDTLEDTKKQRKSGKIASNAKSNSEQMFTPAIQQERFRELNKR